MKPPYLSALTLKGEGRGQTSKTWSCLWQRYSQVQQSVLELKPLNSWGGSRCRNQPQREAYTVLNFATKLPSIGGVFCNTIITQNCMGKSK